MDKAWSEFLRQLTTWHCRICRCSPCCGAAAAKRRAATDRYFMLPGPQQQTDSSGVRRANGTERLTDSVPLHRLCSGHTSTSKPAAAECGGRMGQTDGRTPYRYIDSVPATPANPQQPSAAGEWDRQTDGLRTVT